MAAPALVYDYKVLWFSVYSCKGPGMNLFRTEGVLSCLNTHLLRTVWFSIGEGERKSKPPEIPNNIGSV
jgi:hypothetical protein